MNEGIFQQDMTSPYRRIPDDNGVRLEFPEGVQRAMIVTGLAPDVAVYVERRSVENVILLGAGASRFGGDSTSCSPPAGNELFPRLAERGGVTDQFAEEVRRRFVDKEGGFEAGMELLLERQRHLAGRFLFETGRFLLSFRPGSRNFHHGLVRIAATNADRTLLSSLNYDLILEDAITEAGLRIIYSAEYAQRETIRLLKPHGSVNFLRHSGEARVENVNFISNGRAPDSESNISPAARSETEVYFAGNDSSISPAMALYMKGKRVPNSPTFVTRQQIQWEEAVGMAQRIIVIGVHLVEDDAHLWEPILTSPASLHYVGPEGDSIKKWADRRGRKAATETLAKGFGDESNTRLESLLRG